LYESGIAQLAVFSWPWGEGRHRAPELPGILHKGGNDGAQLPPRFTVRRKRAGVYNMFIGRVLYI
jgi:phosphoketolase